MSHGQHSWCVYIYIYAYKHLTIKIPPSRSFFSMARLRGCGRGNCSPLSLVVVGLFTCPRGQGCGSSWVRVFMRRLNSRCLYVAAEKLTSRLRRFLDIPVVRRLSALLLELAKSTQVLWLMNLSCVTYEGLLLRLPDLKTRRYVQTNPQRIPECRVTYMRELCALYI